MSSIRGWWVLWGETPQRGWQVVGQQGVPREFPQPAHNLAGAEFHHGIRHSQSQWWRLRTSRKFLIPHLKNGNSKSIYVTGFCEEAVKPLIPCLGHLSKLIIYQCVPEWRAWTVFPSQGADDVRMGWGHFPEAESELGPDVWDRRWKSNPTSFTKA